MLFKSLKKEVSLLILLDLGHTILTQFNIQKKNYPSQNLKVDSPVV
ncbi:hypothetical protein LEP1GSC148_4710 [Leptospira interrogans serovar Canicola str. LT1962]|nr:hypothetical protein LEP1GSC148_4710 [Leptospira interrogans serovar Canicola str. LT1962]